MSQLPENLEGQPEPHPEDDPQAPQDVARWIAEDPAEPEEPAAREWPELAT